MRAPGGAVVTAARYRMVVDDGASGYSRVFATRREAVRTGRRACAERYRDQTRVRVETITPHGVEPTTIAAWRNVDGRAVRVSP